MALGPPSSSSASTPSTPPGAARARHHVGAEHREVASINHRYQRGRPSRARRVVGRVTSIPWCRAPLGTFEGDILFLHGTSGEVYIGSRSLQKSEMGDVS